VVDVQWTIRSARLDNVNALMRTRAGPTFAFTTRTVTTFASPINCSPRALTSRISLASWRDPAGDRKMIAAGQD
jgi:hypothetical protein